MKEDEEKIYKFLTVDTDGKTDPMETDSAVAVYFNEESQGVTIEFLPLAVIDSAKGGDKKSIMECARMMADIIECDLRIPLDRPPPRKQEALLIDWLLEALRKVASGDDPDSSFSWRVPGAGRGRKKPGIVQSVRRQIIANNISNLVDSGHAKSVDEAVQIVAEAMGQSEDATWKYYNAYKDLPIFGGRKK